MKVNLSRLFSMTIWPKVIRFPINPPFELLLQANLRQKHFLSMTSALIFLLSFNGLLI